MSHGSGGVIETVRGEGRRWKSLLNTPNPFVLLYSPIEQEKQAAKELQDTQQFQ